jgi:hypothetical protein
LYFLLAFYFSIYIEVLIFVFFGKENTMYIQEITNKHGATVYHVEDEGCIQEFWSKEQAQEYIDYVKEIYSHWEEV